jgi:hypothetical protein
MKEELQKILMVYKNHKNDISNEAQSKKYIIDPILKILGFDTNNINDVICEFTSDIAGKKGEKIDYALKVNNQISILIECKHHDNKLENKEKAQLERYFGCKDVKDVKIAILTNGIIWKFYSSKDTKNLDNEPFYVFNLENEKTYKKLNLFTKKDFNEDFIIDEAKKLQYIQQINDFSAESDTENLKSIFECIQKIFNFDFGGRLTANRIKELEKCLYDARKSFLTDYVMHKITKDQTQDNDCNSIDFTKEELETFEFIKSILRDTIPEDKLELRNLKGLGRSCILFDSTQRKPVLFLDFMEKPFKISIGKNIAFEITNIFDIHKYAKEIIDLVKSYSS